jgi:hypothetical protein
MAIGPMGGLAYLKLDGNQVQLRGSWKIQPYLYENEGVAGQDGVHGFIQKVIIPYMEGDLSDSGGVSITALKAFTGTVTCELDNGKVYVGSSGWAAKQSEALDTAEAKQAVRYEFPMQINEITAG